MGSAGSRPVDCASFLRADLVVYESIVHSIESEPYKQVYRNLLTKKIVTKTNLQAIGVLIYEKAVDKPDISLKCAKLAKSLKDYTISVQNEQFIFHVVFEEVFQPFLDFIILNFERKMLTAGTILRGYHIGTYLGNLYNVDYYGQKTILGICLKMRHNPNILPEFVDNIRDVIGDKLGFGISVPEFLILGGHLQPCCVERSSSESEEDEEVPSNRPEPYKKFRKYLATIRTTSGDQGADLRFFDSYQDFTNMAGAQFKAEIENFAQFLYKGHPEYMIVQRNIATELYRCRPTAFRSDFKAEVIKAIGYFRTNSGATNFPVFVNFMSVFYAAGLIEDECIDEFLNTAKSAKWPLVAFERVLMDVAIKYDRKKAIGHFEYLRDEAKKEKDSELTVAIAEDFVKDESLFGGKKNKIYILSAAALPDLRFFLLQPSSPDQRKTFNCTSRPSCDFAAARGFDLLINHSSHSFFTPERLELCTKISAGQMCSIIMNQKITQEIQACEPYFNTVDCQPDHHLRGLSKFVCALYDGEFVDSDIVEPLLHYFVELIQPQTHKFHSKFVEIFAQLFDKCFRKFRNDQPELCQEFFTGLEDNELAKNEEFPDFSSFRILICASAPGKYQFDQLNKLKRLRIPNDSKAFSQIAKFLVHFLTHANVPACFVVSVYKCLTDIYRPKLDAILLRTEMQHALCFVMRYYCGINEFTFMHKAHQVLRLVTEMCIEKQISRHGLASILCAATSVINDWHAGPVIEFMMVAKKCVFSFLTGNNAMPMKTELLLKEAIENLRNCGYVEDDIDNVFEVIRFLEGIIGDSKRKRKTKKPKIEVMVAQKGTNLTKNQEMDEKPQTLNSGTSILSRETSGLPKPLPGTSKSSETTSGSLKTPKTTTGASKIPETTTEPSKSSSGTSTASKSSSGSPETSDCQPGPSEAPKSIPKLQLDQIKDFSDFCSLYSTLDPFTASHDDQLFSLQVISSMKLSKKQQVSDFCAKFLERVAARQSPLAFFVHTALRLAQDLPYNLKFRKVLIDKICEAFSGAGCGPSGHVLVELMCEFYNKDFVTKAQMVGFVDGFKKLPQAQHLEVLLIYVRNCSLRLTGQGDKQQLTWIRNFAKNVKSSAETERNLKFLAQDLVSCLNLIISIMDVTCNRNAVMGSSANAEDFVDGVMELVLEKPKVGARAARKLNQKHKEVLMDRCQDLIDELPENAENFVEFLTETYNSGILDQHVVTSCIEKFLENSDDISCKLLQIVFEKCGAKLDASKVDAYFRFFQAVIAQEGTGSTTVRTEYFKKFLKLRAQNWQCLEVPKDFYDDFLLQISMDSNLTISSDSVLVTYLKSGEDEMSRFIQTLWKVLLKEEAHPSRVTLCSQLASCCHEFSPKLKDFLAARCKTFSQLDETYYTEDVKQRLGKIIVFVAQLYSTEQSVTDDLLEMWLDTKLTEKISADSVTKLFVILNGCDRIAGCENRQLKMAVEGIKNCRNKSEAAKKMIKFRFTEW